jgi:valyl-tRNA synthetase
LPKPVELSGSLIVTVYPRPKAAHIDKVAESQMQLIQDVSVASRMLRATYGISPAQNIAMEIRIAPGADTARAVLTQHLSMIERSARINATIGTSNDAVPQAAKTLVGADIEIIVPIGGLIDFAAEKTRVSKDAAKAEKDIAGLEKKLGNEDFLAKAPEEVVAEQKARLAEEKSRHGRLLEALQLLSASL